MFLCSQLCLRVKGKEKGVKKEKNYVLVASNFLWIHSVVSIKQDQQGTYMQFDLTLHFPLLLLLTPINEISSNVI